MSIFRGFFTGLLALVLTLAFFAFVGALFFLPVPEGNADLLLTAAGILFGGANMAWGYFLGSSQGSKNKEAAMIAELQPPVNPPTP